MTALKAGDRAGILTLIRDSGRSGDGHKLWLCDCDCGGSVTKMTGVLRSEARVGGVSSCGCIGDEARRAGPTTHGMKGSSTYSSWRAAKYRCENEGSKDYPWYGGRGISLCSQWSASFESFFRHMGVRPNGTSLDRIDPNGKYEPGNCRWASGSEQSRNRRNSVYVQWGGIRKHLSEVAEDLGVSYGAAYMRLKRGNLYENN